MSRSYMTLTRNDEKFSDGTYKCLLKMFDEKESLQGVWTVCTGQGYAQVFRKAGHNIPGSMEPLPQGTYVVHDIQWAGGIDNWSISHGAGLGPVFVPVICPAEKRRGEFGIHLDYNRRTAPGTAGCIGVMTEKDMKDIVKLLRIYDPKILYVQWGV
jgi:lysozyme